MEESEFGVGRLQSKLLNIRRRKVYWNRPWVEEVVLSVLKSSFGVYGVVCEISSGKNSAVEEFVQLS